MQYFITIYIHPMKANIPHAFLGLSHIHPDDLDKQDKQIREEKLKKADWKDFDKKWYESVEINECNDGFFGFAPVESATNHWGKVFENNQYNHEPYENVEQFNDSPYKKTDIRSSSTFQSNNRCVFEISQEQYEELLESIKGI
ncbi:hypothetical protein OQH60_08320 [Campylobacter sp. MIT 21-1685]|uniref:hypothetical protein n=1 Tax=unclassified Campylobacter TaxID=2593542 RepID=UPI00224A4965|nr:MULTISPECIES: hypothetical protein [unclassified Campylobacter]MCX2683860.1 hypothetical protein [Campylobacter sp. MIT 21-1684]MCX2752144.1 hypothetical protein [Campylobacter sp. MIT 21-1682]MCX2808337.1 hypothetical protein [Campylobacter sp. MIT 21-1685]